MTLIAFNVTAHRVDIVTDTWTYTGTGSHFGHASKVTTHPHIDTVIMSQGDHTLGCDVDWLLASIAADKPDFDALVAEAPAVMAAAWDNYGAAIEVRNAATGETCTPTPSALFLIGWSPRAGRFVAYSCSSHNDFELEERAGWFAMPMPLNVKLSDIERARYDEAVVADPRAVHDANRAHLDAQVPGPAPRNRVEWVRFAKLVREHRAITMTPGSHLKVFVGGDLFHTVLKRGSITQERAHRFNDSGEEFARLIAGTLHPASQAAPCQCGSGKRYVDCHLADATDKPCWCQSGKPFGTCCSILAEQHSTPVASARA